MAYILQCDVCKHSITLNDEVLKLTLEEFEYLGDTDFFKNPEHYKGEKILCSFCKHRFAEFLSIQVDFGDRY